MKIDRLFSIVIILLQKNKVTAQELAERFEVSTRTIYRDINVLSAAGIPIYANKGKGGGIALLEDYTISKTMISEKDSEGLLLALKTMQAINYPNIETIFNKLSSLFKSVSIDDWIEVDYSEWDTSTDNIKKFNTIKGAIINSKCIKFKYFNSYGKKTERKVNPLKLIYKGQAWYLWAFCRFRNDFRLFKINRLRDLNVLEEVFDRRELAKLKTYKYEIRDSMISKTVDLKLEFKSTVLYRLYDYFDEKDLIRNNEGSYQLNITFPEGEWIYSFLQSFGENVKVIYPQNVKDELIKRLEANLKNYKS